MDMALKEAKFAFDSGNVPVGAVIVRDGKVIASAHNTKNSSNIAVNHAEILCISEACKVLNSWYLNDCSMYVTLKPCDMCVSAIAEARIKNVFYLVDSNYEFNLLSNKEKISFKKYNDSCEYEKLLSKFFKLKRK